MNSLSIANRIHLGFASLNILLLSVCVAAFAVVTILGTTFSDYRGASKQTLRVNAFVEDLFEARVGSFTYRIAPSAENKQVVVDNFGEIARDIDLFRALDIDAETVTRLDELAELSSRYLADFLTMSDQLELAYEARSLVLATGEFARRELSDLRVLATDNADANLLAAQSSAQEALILGRLYAMEFLNTENENTLALSEEYFQDVAQVLAQARSQLNAAPTRVWHSTALPSIDGVVSQSTEILANLNVMSDALSQYTTLRDTSLNQIGPIMQDSLDLWAEDLIARQNLLGPQGQSIVTQAQVWTPIVGVAVFFAALGVAFAVGKWITVPLGRLATSTTALSEGNVDVQISGAEHKHELGRMAKALEVFRSAHIERLRVVKEREQVMADQKNVVETLSDGLQSLADGDLATRINMHLGDDYEELRLNFNNAIETLERSMTEVVSASSNIDATANSINIATDNLSNRTENQAAALEETAAALEQLTSTVQSSAKRAEEVATTMQETRSNAKRSGEVVLEAVNAMAMIENSSSEIGNIATVIADIAFQTNLLALNAGVEAARAGDTGRGFAVVASEVRSLAQRTSEAAREVSELITNSSAHVSNGTKMINNAGEALETVIQKIDLISQLIADIATNTKEQASGVTEINIGVSQLDQVTQQNAGMVVDSSEQSSELAREAKTLEALVNKFKLSNSVRQLDLNDPSENMVEFTRHAIAV